MDGDYGLTVRIEAEDGTALVEKIFVAADVADGIFTLALDVGPAAFVGPGTRYVAIQVENETPLPRTRLESTPMALVSAVAEGLACTGCVGVAALAPGAVTPAALSTACAPGEVWRREAGGWGCAALPDDVAALSTLATVATTGQYQHLVGLPDLGAFGRLASPNTWSGVQTFGANTDFALNEARRFRFQVSATEPSACSLATMGLAYFDSGTRQLLVCDGTEFVSFSRVGQLGTEQNPGASCRAILSGGGSLGDGPYWIRPGNTTYQVHCDMTTAGGGWTLLLNLHTSDGHVMWWANPLWTSGALRGDPVNPWTGDHKSAAWNDLTAATKVMLVVHQGGIPVGWRIFTKAGTQPMAQYFAAGDNTLLGSASLASNTADVWGNERLVRLSTQLYANHCVQTGGGCTSGTTGSPDGDRLGSHEATPSDNTGGGLGNWHDMHYCCSGQSFAGLGCNGQAFRTVSEAQAGWAGAGGTFGTDSHGSMTNTGGNSNCQDANWASANGVSYHYALYLGE